MGDIDFGPVLASARGRALVSGRALVAELADAMAVPAREALQALAKNFGLEVMETRDMAVLTLASDVLPLAQAIERCALLRTFP